MTEQETSNNIFLTILQAISIGLKIGQNMVPNISITSIFYDATSKQGVNVKQETDKEFIEIDLDKMDMGTFYFVKYQDETYAVRKIGDDQVAFYDVIE